MYTDKVQLTTVQTDDHMGGLVNSKEDFNCKHCGKMEIKYTLIICPQSVQVCSAWPKWRKILGVKYTFINGFKLS